MAARAKTPKVTGLKLTGLTVPLFPDTEAEIHRYGAELARYLNFELTKAQRKRFDKGATIRAGDWLPYSKGAADMLRRWTSKLPEPKPQILKEIARHTEAIQFQALSIATPIRGRRIELKARLELDIPTPEAGVAYLLATVLSAGYGANLRQCGLDSCEVWFFDASEGRRTKEYCCESHSNSQRQRLWRERQKTKKRRHRK